MSQELTPEEARLLSDFAPPDVGERSNWHCWHLNVTLMDKSGKHYICCYCGGTASYRLEEIYDYKGHGRFYPRAIVVGRVPRFTVHCTYICPVNAPTNAHVVTKE